MGDRGKGLESAEYQLEMPDFILSARASKGSEKVNSICKRR